MKQVAVVLEKGFEEGEALTIVDLLKRAGIMCHMFSFESGYVEGMHHMYVKADFYFNDSIKNYDMIILPGGNLGEIDLMNHEKVIEMVQYFNHHHKLIGAINSGTLILEKACVIDGKKVTGYPDYQEQLKSGTYVDKIVVYDQNLITSQGLATVYPFAFKIIEILGKETLLMKERLMYNFAGGR